MISTKMLIKLAKKWHKMAVVRRKEITFPRTATNSDTSGCSASSTAEKGHFVVYTSDDRRFVLPLEYLRNEMVKELLFMAEEEFGLPRDRHLTLPCDGAFMDYAIHLIERCVSREVEKALLTSVARGFCSTSYLRQQERDQQLPLISF